MKKVITISLFLCLFLCVVTSCANQYSVTTNLDKENFKHYFSPGKVKIYQQESDITSAKTYLGSVDGEDCQKELHHEVPNEINARTNARRKAYDLNANAIVFSGCALIDDNSANKQCVATVVCYGKAFQIKDTQLTNH